MAVTRTHGYLFGPTAPSPVRTTDHRRGRFAAAAAADAPPRRAPRRVIFARVAVRAREEPVLDEALEDAVLLDDDDAARVRLELAARVRQPAVVDVLRGRLRARPRAATAWAGTKLHVPLCAGRVLEYPVEVRVRIDWFPRGPPPDARHRTRPAHMPRAAVMRPSA